MNSKYCKNIEVRNKINKFLFYFRIKLKTGNEKDLFVRRVALKNR